jgi:hypothetical protein
VNEKGNTISSNNLLKVSPIRNIDYESANEEVQIQASIGHGGYVVTSLIKFDCSKEALARRKINESQTLPQQQSYATTEALHSHSQTPQTATDDPQVDANTLD